MKKGLKITLIIMCIILVSMISFAGIYKQDKNKMENIIKDYQLGTDLTGSRYLSYQIDTSKETKIYDAEGNELEDTEENRNKEGVKIEEIPANKEDSLTVENYEKSKEIIAKRLEKMQIEDYTISLNKENGTIDLRIPENSNTDLVAQYIIMSGEFKIVDGEDENNILLTNDDIENVKVGYTGAASNGISVFLNITFNKEGKEKLRNISTTYVTTKDEEGNDKEKKISMLINGTEFMNTTFPSEITNGILQLQMGTAQTDETSRYLQESSNIAVLLNTGKLPINYQGTTTNRYIYAETIDKKDAKIAIGIIIALIVIAFIYMIVAYKVNGLLGVISNIGFIAVILLVIRYTNVVLTKEGIIGLALVIALNYKVVKSLLKAIKEEKTYEDKKKKYNQVIKEYSLKLLPILFIAVIFCFAKIAALYCLGDILFWGVVINIIFNYIITYWLLINKKGKEV